MRALGAIAGKKRLRGSGSVSVARTHTHREARAGTKGKSRTEAVGPYRTRGVGVGESLVKEKVGWTKSGFYEWESSMCVREALFYVERIRQERGEWRVLLEGSLVSASGGHWVFMYVG